MISIDFFWLSLGLIGGAVCTWMLSRYKIQLALQKAASETATEHATLTERIQARDDKIGSMEERVREQVSQLDELQIKYQETKTRCVELEARSEEQQQALNDRIAQLREVDSRLNDAFKALSARALESNNQVFMDLAKTTFSKLQEGAASELDLRKQSIDDLVKPIRESLTRVDDKISSLEKARVGAYEGLVSQVQSLLESQNSLRTETANLAKALRSPTTRGRWGEIQLKRVVELAGMVDHCDFYEQQTTQGEDGNKRPDMVIRLPGDKHVVVDAKAPLGAYLEALDAKDDVTRSERMQAYAGSVKRHIQTLGQKAYWDQFKSAPDFVVLFLPGEQFFSAALEHNPALIELGVNQKVIVATPTTLIALLRAVAFGWRQESMTRHAEEVGQLGRQLYKRMKDLAGNVSDVGRHLRSSVASYNKAVGSLESRVLVTARRFHELKIEGADNQLSPVEPLEIAPRELQSVELVSSEEDDGVVQSD